MLAKYIISPSIRISWRIGRVICRVTDIGTSPDFLWLLHFAVCMATSALVKY